VTASAPATVGAERESALGTVLAFLALQVLCWTVFATVTHGAVHHDMAEAWAWGKEPALGYYKHPPVSAWIAYAWFGVFPRTSFFFYLLAETNAALGLLGAWMIAARVLAAPERAASLAMLCLTPLYNLYALKYNANTVLLSLWPWTAYAAIRAVETRRIVWGVAFGVMAALSMLAKYYSGLLLVSCLAAALLHPNARAFFRSPAPYVAVLVGAALISPHVHWMATNGFQTLEYAAATTRHKFSANLLRGLSATVQAFAFHAIPVAALLWALEPKQRAGFARRLVGGAWDRRNWWIVALAFGPFVLTILALLVGNVRISAQFMIPIFFMVPVALLAVSAVPLPWASIRARVERPALLFPLIAVAVSPPIAIALFHTREPTFQEPRVAVAEAATKAWREAFGTRLDIVAGEERYAQGATFYSPDAPSEFTAFDFRLAAGITPERLKRSGMLVICETTDRACAERAKPFLPADAPRVDFATAPKLWWLAGKPRTFVFSLVPPRL
jgi:4-amino-4-deoxy-L-arabinose transferase-like glycosyltransferase